jgi:16S rRNA (guanine1516-N2)-methyltransferase
LVVWVEIPAPLEEWEKSALKLLNWPEGDRSSTGRFGLVREEGQWQLWPFEFKPFKPFVVDYLDSNFLRRLKTFGSSNPLAKAMGRSVQLGASLLDASAGWLNDALFLTKWGMNVTAVERNPAVYLLVRSALERAMKDFEFQTLMKGDICYELSSSQEAEGSWDFVYFDPMYPAKKALSDKPMQILKELVGEDLDSGDVATRLRSKARERLVVKRPPKGEALEKPDYSITSKTVRYDVYLT